MKNTSILTKIDNYFETKKSSETSLILFGVLFIVAFVVYMLTWDPAQQHYDQTQSDHQIITNKLTNTNSFLQQQTVNGDVYYKVKQAQSGLNRLKNDLNLAQKTNLYFDDKLKELSYLLFNEQNWAKFLDSLALLAAKNDVKITKIENDFKNPSPQKIEQVLDIRVDMEGSFKNIVGYINSVEESDLVVDVSHMDLNSTSKDLKGNIGIFVWGMKY